MIYRMSFFRSGKNERLFNYVTSFHFTCFYVFSIFLLIYYHFLLIKVANCYSTPKEINNINQQ